jgi:hypothetical protein
MKLKWAHFTRDELFFFFFSEHHPFFLTRCFPDQCGGQLSAELVKRMEIFLGRPSFWSGASGLQATLVGEGQDCVSLQDT